MSSWTPEHDAELKANFDRGLALSYADVAAAINEKFGTSFSRNAAIGRAARLGLTCLRPKTAKTGPKVKPKPTTARQRPDIAIRKAAAGPKAAPKPFVAGAAEVQTHNVPLLELASDGCRWPSGGWPDATPVAFCNHQQINGLSYCGPHQRLARGQPAERRVQGFWPRAR